MHEEEYSNAGKWFLQHRLHIKDLRRQKMRDKIYGLLGTLKITY